MKIPEFNSPARGMDFSLKMRKRLMMKKRRALSTGFKKSDEITFPIEINKNLNLFIVFTGMFCSGILIFVVLLNIQGFFERFVLVGLCIVSVLFIYFVIFKYAKKVILYKDSIEMVFISSNNFVRELRKGDVRSLNKCHNNEYDYISFIVSDKNKKKNIRGVIKKRETIYDLDLLYDFLELHYSKFR